MKREGPQGPTAHTGISCELNLKNAQRGTSIPGGSQRKVESNISSLGLQTGDGSGRRSRKPNVRPWTLAGASAVPRAAQQAPCRAGSQELLQRAGSCEASSGKPPFDLPSSRGVPLPASQNACSGRDRRGHGAQPHWVDGSSRVLGGADAGQGHTGSWEEGGNLGPAWGPQCSPRAASTPQCCSCFLWLCGKQAGRACSFRSLCCGGSISCQS